MSPLLMSIVTISFASFSTQRRSPAFETMTGRWPPGSAKRTRSWFTLDAKSNPLFGVGFAATIGPLLGFSWADGDGDGDADGAVEVAADAEADGTVLTFGAIDAPGAADCAAVTTCAGTLAFTTVSPLMTMKRSLAAS